MTVQKRQYTIEDLYQLSSDGRYELLDGELVEMSPGNYEHAEILITFGSALRAYVRPRGLGRVFGGDPGVILGRDPDRVRAPDVCFIAAHRLPPGRAPQRYSEIVPDLIVEVVSPTDRPGEVQKKVDEWLRAGARLVLLINPQNETITARDGEGNRRAYHVGDSLTLEPVVPGFSMPVAEILCLE